MSGKPRAAQTAHPRNLFKLTGLEPLLPGISVQMANYTPTSISGTGSDLVDCLPFIRRAISKTLPLLQPPGRNLDSSRELGFKIWVLKRLPGSQQSRGWRW